MKIQHPAVKSDVFKLVTVLEFDLEVGDHFLPTRVELFQDTERKKRWRCRMWERELYRMTVTLPKRGQKKGLMESDEELLVERTWELSDRFDDFKAENAREAMKVFLDRLKKYLKKIAD